MSSFQSPVSARNTDMKFCLGAIVLIVYVFSSVQTQALSSKSKTESKSIVTKASWIACNSGSDCELSAKSKESNY